MFVHICLSQFAFGSVVGRVVTKYRTVGRAARQRRTDHGNQTDMPTVVRVRGAPGASHSGAPLPKSRERHCRTEAVGASCLGSPSMQATDRIRKDLHTVHGRRVRSTRDDWPSDNLRNWPWARSVERRRMAIHFENRHRLRSAEGVPWETAI